MMVFDVFSVVCTLGISIICGAATVLVTSELNSEVGEIMGDEEGQRKENTFERDDLNCLETEQ